MQLTLSNLLTKVVANEDETAWLYEYLSFDDAKARFWNKKFTKSGDTRRHLYSLFSKTFPGGFTQMVYKAAKDQGFDVNVIDLRIKPITRDTSADLNWLRDYQFIAVRAAAKRTRGILWLPTGAGKCLGIGTPVMRYDGTLVPVENIQDGDLLMGPDSNPRTVLSTTRGTDNLYRIVPINGDSWVCNSIHVLTLQHTTTGNLIDIPLNEYLQKSKDFKHLHKLVRARALKFKQCCNTLPVSPYFLGIWLGDGGKDWQKNGIRISKNDQEIIGAMQDEADRFNLAVRTDYTHACQTHRIVSKYGRDGKPNPLKAAIAECIDDDFRIKHIYLTAPLQARLALLAGLIDTDGYLSNGYFEIVQKRKPLAESILFLARSVGLQATIRAKEVKNYGVYWRITICGECSIIPTRIPRKQATMRRQKKDVLRTGFSVEPIGMGDYAGFTLSGDGRFLLGDFTITHNTEIAVGLAVAFPCRWLFLVHRENLMHQAADRYVKRTGAVVGRIGDGRWEEERFTAATFQTLHGALKDEPKNSTNPKTIRARKFLQGIQGVIIDESHTVAADTFYEVTRQIPNAYYRIGISGTPLARGDRRSLLAIGALGPVIYRLRPEVLIERGLLAKPDIKMVKAPAVSRAPTFQGAYGEGIVRNTKRNQIITQVAQVAAKPALVFVKEIKHGKALLQRFQQAGLNAEFVWGTTMTPSRMAAIERLVRADIDVLICSVVLQEGADIPELKSVIVAAAGKSVIATLQRIGRGMRTAEGKGNTFQVWDFIDEGNRMLIKHSHARKNAYEREGHDVTVISALSVTKTDAPEPS